MAATAWAVPATWSPEREYQAELGRLATSAPLALWEPRVLGPAERAQREQRHAGAAAGVPRAPGRPGQRRTAPAWQAIERTLRELPHLDWWYDPALPIEQISFGMPKWARGRRRDTGETAESWARHVDRYRTALRDGAVFPPALAGALCTPEGGYALLNGRHRAAGFWLEGRCLPAFVVSDALGSRPSLVAAARRELAFLRLTYVSQATDHADRVAQALAVIRAAFPAWTVTSRAILPMGAAAVYTATEDGTGRCVTAGTLTELETLLAQLPLSPAGGR